MRLETPSSGQKPSEEAVSRSEGSLTLISTTRRVPAVKPVGKPDAGNPHVRFDERGGETDRSRGTAPLLDSTRLPGQLDSLSGIFARGGSASGSPCLLCMRVNSL